LSPAEKVCRSFGETTFVFSNSKTSLRNLLNTGAMWEQQGTRIAKDSLTNWLTFYSGNEIVDFA